MKCHHPAVQWNSVVSLPHDAANGQKKNKKKKKKQDKKELEK